MIDITQISTEKQYDVLVRNMYMINQQRIRQ